MQRMLQNTEPVDRFGRLYGLICLQSELFRSYPKFKRIELVQPGVGIKYFQHLVP